MKEENENIELINEEINLVVSLFEKVFPNFGDILLPNDDFYGKWDNSGNALRLMASRIFDWLNYHPEDLIIDFYDKMEPPGIYIHNGDRKCVLVNSKHNRNPFECAAILTHEIMHYYLMYKHKIVLDNTLANELLTDLATIYAGLGILIINSFRHESNWHITTIGLMFGQIISRREKMSFGYFDPHDYCKYFKNFLDKFNIGYNAVFGHTVSKAKYFLPFVFDEAEIKNKPNYIILAEKTKSKETRRRIIIVAIFIPLAILFWCWRSGSFNKTKSLDDLTITEQTQLQQSKQSLEEIRIKAEDCEKDLKSKGLELDNIEKRMSIFKNANSIDQYNNLVPEQNILTNDYNNKGNECGKLQNDYNSKVSEYNSLIKK